MKVYETRRYPERALPWLATGTPAKTALTAPPYSSPPVLRQRLETITDFDEEEIARKITIASAVAATEVEGERRSNPYRTLQPKKAASTFLPQRYPGNAHCGRCGSGGRRWHVWHYVEVQTEKVWTFTDEFVLPRAVSESISSIASGPAFVSARWKMCRLRSGARRFPFKLPIGAEEGFQRRRRNLVRMKVSYVGRQQEGEIPADLADAAKAAHEALVEMVAEGNDALLEEFFNEGTLPVDHILDGLREAVRVSGDLARRAVRVGNRKYRPVTFDPVVYQ